MGGWKVLRLLVYLEHRLDQANMRWVRFFVTSNPVREKISRYIWKTNEAGQFGGSTGRNSIKRHRPNRTSQAPHLVRDKTLFSRLSLQNDPSQPTNCTKHTTNDPYDHHIDGGFKCWNQLSVTMENIQSPKNDPPETENSERIAEYLGEHSRFKLFA
jgi:hypothetical protein